MVQASKFVDCAQSNKTANPMQMTGKMQRLGFLPFAKRKIVDPLVQIVRRGAEPGQLAFSFALGFTLGLFPICGSTVLLCGIAIAMLRSHCNAVTVMIANFIATPFELSLLIPFLRFGEFISGGSHFPLTADAMKRILTFQASKQLLIGVFHAVLGWVVTSPLILVTFYLILLPLFRLLAHKLNGEPSIPKRP